MRDVFDSANVDAVLINTLHSARSRPRAPRVLNSNEYAYVASMQSPVYTDPTRRDATSRTSCVVEVAK